MGVVAALFVTGSTVSVMVLLGVIILVGSWSTTGSS